MGASPSSADDQEDDPDGDVEEGVGVEEPDAAGDVRLSWSQEAKEDELNDPGDDQKQTDSSKDTHRRTCLSSDVTVRLLVERWRDRTWCGAGRPAYRSRNGLLAAGPAVKRESGP